ncbi:MAG: LacI family DNA-binding transcriptional regulator [bacterium]|nr:LacI family transcriptional regulator [Alphaproteobacteria bacterium]MDI1365052.1 LacI family DNA-binding transcriptional regulator [bacterium]
MTAKKPTIDDVARRSGVARVTVSRVLNGGPNVSDAVRAKVIRAVEELDYKVNPQARSLAGGASRLLAFVFASDPENEPNSYYESALELGALRACLALGYQVLIQNVPQSMPDRQKRVLDLITTQRCEGLILSPPYSDDIALIDAALAQGCRVVAVSPGGAGCGKADGVGIDDEAGGYDMARELLRLGHRRFGFLAGLEGHLSADRRLEGFKRALAEQGLGSEAYVALRGDFTFRSGTRLAPELLDHSLRPTALVCANDDMAAGVLSAAHARGLSIPADLSITGFDDAPVAGIVWPPLTTVHQPVKDLGQRAVELLVARLTGANSAPGPVFELLDHAVVSRQTTAPG